MRRRVGEREMGRLRDEETMHSLPALQFRKAGLFLSM